MHDAQKPKDSVVKPSGIATCTLPAELRSFFPGNEELVRRLDAMRAALQGG